MMFLQPEQSHHQIELSEKLFQGLEGVLHDSELTGI